MKILRLPTVALAITCAGLTSATSAQEEAPPDKLRPGLHLEPEHEYGFRFTETVATSSKNAHSDGRKSETSQDSTATWDVRLSLVETRDDGSVVVEVTVDRLRGTYDDAKMEPRSYDTDENGSRAATMAVMLGEASTLVVSPSGAVVEASGALEKALEHSPKGPDRDPALAFFQWLFPPLPDTPQGRGKTIEAARPFAPNLVSTGVHIHPPIEEKLKLTKIKDGRATATASAKGSFKAEKSAKKDETVGNIPTKWGLKGAAEIDLTTGLYISRTAEWGVSTYMRIVLPDNTIVLNGRYDITRSIEAIELPEDE